MSVGYVYRRPSPEGLRHSISNEGKSIRHSERRGERSAPAPNYLSDTSLSEKERVLRRMLAQRAGLPEPESIDNQFTELGNRELPIWKRRDELLRAVRDNQVSLLEGDTGSGKSTQAWQYLVGEGYERVYVLVPRRVIAENLFERAREEMTEQRDEVLAISAVGIAHSEHVELSDDNKVVFLTSETFHKLNAQIREELGDKPVVIIGDEIHEANLPTEMAVATAAQQLGEHPNWRLVLSSATHDKQRVLNRFRTVNKTDVPVVSVEGRPHNIEFYEKPNKSPAEIYADNYWDHGKSLFFTSGKFEIDEGIKAFQQEIDRRKKGASERVIFRKLHAKMSEAERLKLNAPVPPGHRLVIVSSPAGMSGMTFPGTTLVITDGLVKRPELDYEGTPGLFKQPASRAEIVQMIGRGGRDVSGGIGFLCAPFEEEFSYTPMSEREENAPAEIYNTNISRNVLTAASYGYDFHDLNRFALHQVDKTTILDAYESLFRLGAVDEDDSITSLGRRMNELPLRPELSRGLVEAIRRGATQHNIARLAIISSCVEAGGLPYFAHNAGEEWRSLLRETTIDDYIAQLDMYQGIRKYDSGAYVDEEGLLGIDIDPKNAFRARKQYHKIMRSLGVKKSEKLPVLPPNPAEEEQIRDYLLSGMIDLVYQRGGKIGQTVAYKSVTQGEMNDMPTEKRTTSRRSVLTGAPEFVAGWPRRFIQKGVMRHVVEMAMPVDVERLARHASHLASDETIGFELRGDGHLFERVQPVFGRIALGETVVKRTDTGLSPRAEKLLVETVLASQGEAQRHLRHIARELDAIYERLPEDVVHDFVSDRPRLTQQDITEMVKRASVNARSTGQVDNRLRETMYQNGIDLAAWISPEKHKELQENYPNSIELMDGSFGKLSYKDGVPVITNLTPATAWKLWSDCELPNGQEVFVQMVIGDEKRLFTADQYHTMATAEAPSQA